MGAQLEYGIFSARHANIHPLSSRSAPAVSRTVWLTGLSGSGKTTLAQALAQALAQQGRACVVLDGDAMRHGLCRDLGFSLADRSENIRRVAEVAKLFNATGSIAIAALISPRRQDRAHARHIVGASAMCEVYLATPMAACEQRDSKGLYRRARAGLIADFTGISADYEAPLEPSLVLDSSTQSVEDCVAPVLQRLAD